MRQGLDDAIAEHVEYKADTECLTWTGAMHRTGRFPVVNSDRDYVSVRAHLFAVLPGARRPGFTTVWASSCGDRRCVAFLHAEVRSYHPKRRAE